MRRRRGSTGGPSRGGVLRISIGGARAPRRQTISSRLVLPHQLSYSSHKPSRIRAYQLGSGFVGLSPREKRVRYSTLVRA